MSLRAGSPAWGQAPDPLAWQTELLYRLFKDGSIDKRLPTEFRARVRAVPSTHNVFFPNEAAPMFPSGRPAYMDKVSKLTVAAALGRVDVMGFSNMVRDAQPQLKSAMNLMQTPDAKAERDEIAQVLVTNSEFAGYFSSPSTWQTRPYWANKLFTYLTTDQFLNKEGGLLSGLQPHWVQKMAWDAHKVELLDASRLGALLAIWEARFPGQKLAEMVRSRDFYPALPDWNGEVDATKENVKNAIASTREEHSHSNQAQGGAGARSFNHASTTTYYGEGVISFVQSQLGPMNLWTGATPNNTTEDHS